MGSFICTGEGAELISTPVAAKGSIFLVNLVDRQVKLEPELRKEDCLDQLVL